MTSKNYPAARKSLTVRLTHNPTVASTFQESDHPNQRVRQYLIESAELKRAVAETCAEAIVSAAKMITNCFLSGNKVLLCGNGGSAADCQHIAAELMGNLSKDLSRRGLAAIALTVDTSFLTAYANDSGFEHVFERQVQALGNEGDVLVAISTSGKSPNVLRALGAARAAKLKTILLSSASAPNVAAADILIAVPSNATQHIQEAHLAIEHLICELVETSLFVAPTRE